MISRKKSVLCVLSAREIGAPLSSSHKGIPPEQVPVKRHRGEPGHARDTRAHGSHRRTSQPSKPTMQPTAVRSRPTLSTGKKTPGGPGRVSVQPDPQISTARSGSSRSCARVRLWVGMVVRAREVSFVDCPRAIRVSVVPVLVIYYRSSAIKTPFQALNATRIAGPARTP